MPRDLTLLLILYLLVHLVSGCIPSGGGLFGSGMFGGSSGSCGCTSCPCSSYSAPQVPAPSYSPYSYSQAVPQAPVSGYQQVPPLFGQAPLPPPPPPPPVVIPASPSSSSYQGQYQDKPANTNSAYQGKAPLGFSNSYTKQSSSIDSASETAAGALLNLNPLNYLEHVSVSHVPASPPAPSPPPTYNFASEPADPFSGIPVVSSGSMKQIQVAPSSVATAEDEYLPSAAQASAPTASEFPGFKNSSKPTLVTYYNQICSGEKIATNEKETFNSATKKCELLNCVAANALPDGSGTYTVTYLRTATSRTNRKGNYCLSSKQLRAKSKRIIRRFDDMLASEEANRVRRLLLHRRLH